MFEYFLGAKFVQNQLTRIQASKSDLEKSMAGPNIPSLCVYFDLYDCTTANANLPSAER